ncbi:MAG: transposase [Bacilli bacterium]|nr:transposase [Bacilli bacterium]MDY6362788.1 transposase [Bacilli bacterium]
MIVDKTYRFRVYPNEEQKHLIEKTLGCVRQVYNDFLEMTFESYQNNGSIKINKFALIKLLPEYKKTFPYLKEVDSIALQQSVVAVYYAYCNFFKHRCSFPKFHTKRKDRSYTTMNINNSIRISGKEIQMPKLGKLKIVCHRSLPCSFKFKFVSMTRVGSHYYVSLTGKEICFNLKDENNKHLMLNKSIGIDFSLSDFLVDNNGNRYRMPSNIHQMYEKIKVAQRKQSKMQLFSKNWFQQKRRIDLLFETLTNKRLDYLHKLSRKIADTYDYVFVENLRLNDIASREKREKFGKRLYRLSFGKFLKFLDYKTKWLGKKMVRIDTFYPSSQICNDCGFRNKLLALKTKVWKCPNCGTVHNRDYNAAKNILNEGSRLVLNM